MPLPRYRLSPASDLLPFLPSTTPLTRNFFRNCSFGKRVFFFRRHLGFVPYSLFFFASARAFSPPTAPFFQRNHVHPSPFLYCLFLTPDGLRPFAGAKNSRLDFILEFFPMCLASSFPSGRRAYFFFFHGAGSLGVRVVPRLLIVTFSISRWISFPPANRFLAKIFFRVSRGAFPSAISFGTLSSKIRFRDRSLTVPSSFSLFAFVVPLSFNMIIVFVRGGPFYDISLPFLLSSPSP